MKLLLLLFIVSCSVNKAPELAKGDCVLGENMEVWELLRQDEGKYLFAQFPVREGVPVHVVEDLRPFKKVDCPPIK